MSQHTNQTAARVPTGRFLSHGVRQATHWLLDLLFPPRCVHCDRVDTTFCDTCTQALRQQPLTIQQTTLANDVRVVSTGVHEGILQAAVQALKYYNGRDLASPLATRLAQVVQAQMRTIDIIIPVPMHPDRLRQRGYNQANELSQALANQLDRPNHPAALTRERATRSQVGLNKAERLTNVAGAFQADADLVNGQQVLLVDDVHTTGATLHACAQAAFDAGARLIYAVTVSAAK